MSTPYTIILSAIDTLGEVTTRELSQHVSLRQPTVTIMLDKLETKGFIERYRSSRDRRIVHSRLTASGREILAQSQTPLPDTFLSEFENLPAARQALIMSVLEQVANMMTKDTSTERQAF